MDHILIRNLHARGPIGITEEERSRPQDILINVTVGTDTRAAAQSDRIDDCINYSTLTKQVLRLVEGNQRKTVEALAGDIADLCLEHPLAQTATVRVEKTSIVRFTDAVGVEIERSKAPVENQRS